MTAVVSIYEKLADDKQKEVWKQKSWKVKKVEKDRQRTCVASKMQQFCSEVTNEEQSELVFRSRNELERREEVDLHCIDTDSSSEVVGCESVKIPWAG